MEMKIDSRELAKFKKDMKDYKKGTSMNIAETLKSAGIAIQNRAQIGTIVDTGRLRASIHAEFRNLFSNKSGKFTSNSSYKDKNGKNFDGDLRLPLEENEVAIGTNVKYANKIEKRDNMIIKAFDDIVQKFMKQLHFDLLPKNMDAWRNPKQKIR